MTVEVLADGMGFADGPVLLPDGQIAVTLISHGYVYVVDRRRKTKQRIATGGGPNGLAVDSDGTIHIAENGGIFGASGTATSGVHVIRDGRVDYLAEGMDAPKDLLIGPDGRLWMTDTRAEIDFFDPEQSKCGWVWAVDVNSGAKELVLDSEPVFINGLGFDPRGGRLMATTKSSAQLWGYSVEQGGHLSGADGGVLCTFEHGWPDGIAVRNDGGSWVALTGGHRLDLVGGGGQILGSVALPGGALPTNVCLEKDPDELFVTAAFRLTLLRVWTRPC